MKRWIRLVLLCAVLCALCLHAAAYEIPADFTGMSLEQVMEDFRTQNGLNENNFSISYRNTVTGETYTYNDTKFMVAGSTYKLPLNMYYYEMEREGEIEPTAYLSRIGTTLDDAHYQSLVESNNEISIGMLYNLGEFRDYKESMRKYFTMTDEEIDYVYYVDNYYCTRMMMDALSYLYEYRADFSEMIGYMKQAQPNEYFRAWVTDYEVAHKYGFFEGAVNDVGILYTPEPILLAVYTQDTAGTVVSDAAALLVAWQEWNLAQAAEAEEETPDGIELEIQYVPIPEEPAEEEVPPAQPQEPDVIQPSEGQPPQPESPQEVPQESAFEWWMVAVALGVFLQGGGLTVMIAKPFRKKLEEEESEEEPV